MKHPHSACRAPRWLAASSLSLAICAAWSQSEGASTTAPVQRPAVPAAAMPAVQDVVLKEVRFPTTAAVPLQDLQAVAQPFVGQRFGQAELDSLAQALRALYERRGHGLTAIGFPSQTLSDGVLTVNIVEARLGRVSLQSSSAVRLSDDRVHGLLDHVKLRSGALLNLKALDRAMFALNDLPGIGAKATLSPTGDEGVYDLAVELEARKAYDLAVEVDNHGSRAGGRLRAGVVARWNNPGGIGDNLDVRLMRTNGAGLTLGRLGYELPLGATPARAAIGYSRVSYALGEEFEALGAAGVATVADAAVSYPVWRSRERNLVLRLMTEDKRLEDRFDAVEVRTDKRVRNVVAALAFEAQDTLGGGGFTGAALQLSQGRLDIESDDARAADALLGEQATQGRFRKLGLQVSRLQAIAPRVSAYVGVAAQWAQKNLDGAERMTLGGPGAVRAYPSAESPSDQGWMLRSELRWSLSPKWTVYALHDRGQGESRKRADPGALNRRSLYGSGFGVYFADPAWFNLSATASWRGKERALSEPQDSRMRLYLQLQRPF